MDPKGKASESPLDTEYFTAIRETVEKHRPDALVAPTMMYGASDSRFFREKGITCYGVWPVFIPMEEANRVHGIDERISAEEVVNGSNLMTDIARKLCTD